MTILLHNIIVKEVLTITNDYKYTVTIKGTALDPNNGGIPFDINVGRIYTDRTLSDLDKEDIIIRSSNFIKNINNINIPTEIEVKEHLWLGTCSQYVSEYKQCVPGNRIEYIKNVKDRKSYNKLRKYITGSTKLFIVEDQPTTYSIYFK